MNIQSQDVNATRKSIIVSISPEELSKEQSTLVKQFATQVKIPGFRPGKAPEQLVKTRFTKEILDELRSKVVSSAYQEVTKDDSLKIYNVTALEGNEFESIKEEVNLTFTVDIEPTFELPEYKGLEIHKHPEEASDEEVQSTIDSNLEQRAEYNPVERPAKETDYVKLSYEGKIGDQAVADLAPDAPMYGKQAVTWEQVGNKDAPAVQSVVDALDGMSVGDKKTVEHTFADDFNVEALAGKTATYEIEVSEVREKALPAIDQEFLDSVNAESEEAYRDQIKTQVVGRKAQENARHMAAQVTGKLNELCVFEVPESAVENETQKLLQNHMQHLMRQGVTPEMFEQHKDQMIESAQTAAKASAQTTFILKAIAEKEEIKVESEDFNNRIMQEAYMSGTKPDELVKRLQGDRALLDTMHNEILSNKTLDFLVKSANVTVQEHCDTADSDSK